MKSLVFSTTGPVGIRYDQILRKIYKKTGYFLRYVSYGKAFANQVDYYDTKTNALLKNNGYFRWADRKCLTAYDQEKIRFEYKLNGKSKSQTGDYDHKITKNEQVKVKLLLNGLGGDVRHRFTTEELEHEYVVYCYNGDKVFKDMKIIESFVHPTEIDYKKVEPKKRIATYELRYTGDGNFQEGERDIVQKSFEAFIEILHEYGFQRVKGNKYQLLAHEYFYYLDNNQTENE